MSAARSIPVERALAAYCRTRGLQFMVDGTPEPAIRVLSPEAFLPIVVLHAEMAANEALTSSLPGRPNAFPLGSSLYSDDDSLFGVFARVRPLEGDGTGGFRAAMFTYALHKVFGWSFEVPVECAGIFERYQGEGLQRALDALGKTTEGSSQWPPTIPR